MNIDQLKEALKFLSSDNLVVELFFLFKEEDEIQIKRARLADIAQKPIAQELVKPFLDRELETSEKIIAYDPTMSPDCKVIFEISQSEIEQYALLMNSEINNFDDKKDYEDIWAYMIKVSKGNDEIMIVRKKFGSHTLKKGFSLWLSNGQLSRFEKSVFTLDEHIDAFLLNNNFYVFQRTNFERSFLFDQKIKVQAERNAKEIISEHHLLTLDLGKLDSYLDQHTMSRLRRIDMSLIEDGTMSYQRLSNFCNEFGITITKDDSVKKFVPKDKKEFRIFVKLLSDDYLESSLTSKKYDVHSKEALADTD